MADRVNPPANPTPIAAAPPILNPPPSRAQLHNPTRHPYRPTLRSQKQQKHSCRRCFCLTCFWLILLLIAIILLAAIGGAVFYALYNPQRPTFSVTALKFSSFNLTTVPSDDSTHLTTNLNLTLTAKNPNKRMITFLYDPISITVRSNSVNLGTGPFSNFTSSPNTISVIHTTIGANSEVVGQEDLNSLNSDLKRKNGLPINIVVDTAVGVKIEKLKMKKIGIRVKCTGISGAVPMGKSVIPAAASTSKAKCKVVLRIKIFKSTILI